MGIPPPGHRGTLSLEVGSSFTARAQKVVDRRFKNLWLNLRKARFAENLYIILVSTVSQQMVVHSLSCSMISRLSTICFSTVSPSPLTAEAPHQSPSGSSSYGSRKPGVTN